MIYILPVIFKEVGYPFKKIGTLLIVPRKGDIVKINEELILRVDYIAHRNNERSIEIVFVFEDITEELYLEIRFKESRVVEPNNLGDRDEENTVS